MQSGPTLFMRSQQRCARSKSCEDIEAAARNALDMAELAVLESEEDAKDILAECRAELEDAKKVAQTQQTLAMLSGPSDKQGCFVEVKAGAGGAESQDWAEMLLTTYAAWGKEKGYAAEIVDVARTDVGIRDGTARIDGAYAFGWLRTEMGVHRMVRHSVHGSAGKRQTCFAQVIVIPIADGSGASSAKSFDIPVADIKVETFRSGGLVVSTPTRQTLLFG